MPYNSLHLCIVLLIHAAAIAGLALVQSTTYFEPESLIYPCCCTISLLSIGYLVSWFWLTKKLFDPYIIFLTAAVLFNAGQVFLEVFHLNPAGLLRGQYSAATLCDTLFYVALGLSTFHLGALLSLGACNAFAALSTLRQPFRRTLKSRRKGLALSQDEADGRANHANSKPSAKLLDTSPGVVRVGWGLASIAILPSIFVFLKSFQVVLSKGYQGLYQGDQDTSVAAAPAAIGNFLIPAAFFLLVGSTDKNSSVYSKWGRNAALALIVLFVVSSFLLGERRKVATAIAALGWLWHFWITKLPATVVFGVAAALGLIFPVVAATRNLIGQQGASSEAIERYGSSNPLISTLNEMGGSS